MAQARFEAFATGPVCETNETKRARVEVVLTHVPTRLAAIPTYRDSRVTFLILPVAKGNLLVKNWNALENRTTRRILPIACATALAATFMVSLPKPAHAAPAPIVVPAVPPNIRVDTDVNKVFLLGHGVGTQNYVCSRSGTGVKYVLFTPQATLFDDDDKQIITHYFSPNPFERNTDPAVVADGPIRVTWQDKDTSTIWGSAALQDGGDASTDAQFVAKDAVAWLRVKILGAEAGPTGGDKLAQTTFVQRLNTQGGLAPSTGCASLDDLGNKAFVPYTADYFFYELR